MTMWVQSYEKQSVQECVSCFVNGKITPNFHGDEGDDFYERYYPGFYQRRRVVNACCYVIKECVKLMPIDISQHQALRQHDYNVLRGELIGLGVSHEDMPSDTWLKMLNNEIVQVFLKRRKGYEFENIDEPPEFLEPDEYNKRYVIINGEVCAPIFEHKTQQIWKATFPIYSYPRALRRENYAGEVQPGYPSYKQLYFAIIGDDILCDSTKARIIKKVNAALRGW